MIKIFLLGVLSFNSALALAESKDPITKYDPRYLRVEGNETTGFRYSIKLIYAPPKSDVDSNASFQIHSDLVSRSAGPARLRDYENIINEARTKQPPEALWLQLMPGSSPKDPLKYGWLKRDPLLEKIESLEKQLASCKNQATNQFTAEELHSREKAH